MSSSSKAPSTIDGPLAVCVWKSPVGPMEICAGDGGLRYLIFAGEDRGRLAAPARPVAVAVGRGLAPRRLAADRPPAQDNEAPAPDAAVASPPPAACAIAEQAQAELAEYFAGRRRAFSVPPDLRGTEFQRRVWEALCQIEYGTTISYRELAARVGRPAAIRAAGAANGANPISVIVPCHRVIGSDGSLTGYGGGIDVKRYLLDLEQAAGSA